MREVFVSGGTGFIGRGVVEALVAAGDSVVLLGRSSDHDVPAAFRKLDLLDTAAVTTVIRAERPRHLVHLAWDVSHGDYWYSDMNRAWSDATIRLAEVFAEHGGRRLVVAGTCAERAPTLSATPYAQSKARTRDALGEIGGLEVVWIRIFFPTGAHEEPRRLIPSLIRNLATKHRFLVREPSLVRDFCSVDDVGRAFAAAVRGTRTGIYEVGTGIGITLGEAAATVANLMDRDELLDFGDESPPDPLVASTDELSDHFGWDAMISPHDALAQAVDWWKDQK